MLEISKQYYDLSNQPTSLRFKVSKFLDSNNRYYVIGVNFIDGGALIPNVNGDIGRRATSYAFNKEESSFWHKDFSVLFQ